MPTAVIAEDEPLLADVLREHLADVWPELSVVACATDGDMALSTIRALRPDVAFLDIRMPGLSGLQVARHLLDDAHVPVIVFVTAYDQYALAAFGASATDYLLKPVEEARLAQALDRVRTQLAARAAAGHRDRLLQLLAHVSGRPQLCLDEALAGEAGAEQGATHLTIRDGARIVRVAQDAVQWVDAAGDYLCIHTPDETFVLRATLRDMEQRLDPRRFQRIHRSTIVNIGCVRELRAHQNGEYFVLLDGGQTLKLSRSYRDKVPLLA